MEANRFFSSVRRAQFGTAATLLLAVDLVLFISAPHWLQAWAALIVAALLPGQLLAALLWRDVTIPGLGARLLLGVGLGYGLLIVMLLGLSYWPGGIDFGPLLLLFNLLNAALIALHIAAARCCSRSPLIPA